MKRSACLVCLFVLTACGGGAGSFAPPDSNPRAGLVAPSPNPQGGSVSTDPRRRPTYPSSTGGVIPQSAIKIIPVTPAQVGGDATATDGSFWYTAPLTSSGLESNAIVRVTLGGNVTTFFTPSAGSAPEGITLARDGNLYAAEEQIGAIVRITPSGQMTEFPVPRSLDATPNIYQVGTGPDGNVWFVDINNNTLGEMNITTLAFTSFSLSYPASSESRVITGPDNDLWVSNTTPDHENGAPFQRYTTDGKSLSQINTMPSPTGFLTTGPDGYVWASAYAIAPDGQLQSITIERMSTSGVLGLGPSGPGSMYGTLGQIVAGGDRNIYVGAQFGQLLQTPTSTGQVAVFTLPGGCPNDYLAWLSPGPNQVLWAYDINNNDVDLIDLKSI